MLGRRHTNAIHPETKLLLLRTKDSGNGFLTSIHPEARSGDEHCEAMPEKGSSDSRRTKDTCWKMALERAFRPHFVQRAMRTRKRQSSLPLFRVAVITHTPATFIFLANDRPVVFPGCPDVVLLRGAVVARNTSRCPGKKPSCNHGKTWPRQTPSHWKNEPFLPSASREGCSHGGFLPPASREGFRHGG